MKRVLLGLVAALALAGVARADTPSTAVMLANTTGAIVIEVDGLPMDVLFISTTGEVALISMEDCHADPQCVALGVALAKAHKVEVLNLKAPEHV